MNHVDIPVRVWFRGPITVRDENSARVDGFFKDLPHDTKAAFSIQADGSAVPWAVKDLGSHEVRGNSPWVFVDSAWVKVSYVETIDEQLNGQLTEVRSLVETTHAVMHTIKLTKADEFGASALELHQLLHALEGVLGMCTQRGVDK